VSPLHVAQPWMSALHLEALVRFESLPSTLLHPDRIAQLLPRTASTLFDAAPHDSMSRARLHRHWSEGLRNTLGLEPITHYDEPALRVASLPAQSWAQLIVLGGAMLGGPGIRRVIARNAVEALEATLGTDAVNFAYSDSGTLHGGILESSHLSHAELTNSCQQWGAALLWRAFEAASTAVAQRAWLRLPAQAQDWASTTLSTLPENHALALATELTERANPTWLSSFPATR